MIFISTMAFGQLPKTCGYMDIGYSSKGYISYNGGAVMKKLLLGIGFDMSINSGEEGEYYSEINWDEFPGDIVSSGKYIEPLFLQLGYNILGNLYCGVGLGFGEVIYYRNMYDNYHILGNNGSYYINAPSGKIEFQKKVFATYFFPIKNDLFPYLVLNLQYATISGFAGSVGAVMGM